MNNLLFLNSTSKGDRRPTATEFDQSKPFFHGEVKKNKKTKADRKRKTISLIQMPLTVSRPVAPTPPIPWASFSTTAVIASALYSSGKVF